MSGDDLSHEIRQQIREAARAKAAGWRELTPDQLAALAGPMDVGLPAERQEEDKPGTAA